MGKPKIRFKGFTEEWEQRKLNDIADVRDGTHDSPKYVQEGHPFITSKNVSNGCINYDDVQYVTDEDYEEINKRSKVDMHDILMGMIGTIGNLALIREKPDFAIKNVALIKYTGDVDYQFLYQALQTGYVTNQLSTGMDGGTQKFVSLKKIRELDIPYPEVPEQEKIGIYFTNLDHLITLHQRKCDETKKLKKYMLQKMFPQNGMKVPEIRFEGFTGDWEQRKVGEFYDFKNGLNKGKEFFGEGTPIVNFTDVFYNRDIYAKSLKGKVTLEPNEIKNYEVKKGDIFFTRTSETIEEIGYPSVMLDVAENTVFSGFVLRGRCCQSEDPLDDLFKKYVFFTDAFREEMLKKSSMTTRALTSGTVIKNMIFRFPKSKEEQHKIAEYLTTLDYLITLHQRKRDELVKIKKYMLQNMFV